MAKKTTLWNISPGILGLPNGVQIGPGESLAIGEFAENAGVLSWVADGLASFDGPAQVVIVRSDDVAAVEAALAAMTAERDVALAKIAELEAAKT